MKRSQLYNIAIIFNKKKKKRERTYKNELSY
jgi:hypothetical protein